ncbi:ribbon-helix-helix domain-containing protein [Dietzia sp. 179-F 9C3 NHS]|uniref:ribbon-helix-helix domain-containing protein n=1 Tax=Dietzia sp. 179-F 9C3 NHS TaxID=3374295 RepID=UPI00387920D1
MKISVSLSEEDVALIDRYAGESGLGSRSAVIRDALRRLRDAELEAAYEDAFTEWAGSDDALLWDETTGDGLGDEAR